MDKYLSKGKPHGIKITILGNIMEGRQLSLALHLQTLNFVF
jgi:hypothetical protein